MPFRSLLLSLVAITALFGQPAADAVLGFSPSRLVLEPPLAPFASPTSPRQTPEGSVFDLPPLSEDPLRLTTFGSLYVLSFRVELAGAAAVRVHFQDFHLPPGTQVYVYGLDSSSLPVSLAGPYQASGRLLSGDFWAAAVPGPVAVVELQTTEPLPTLPFEIREAAALTAMPGEETVDPPLPTTQAVSWIHGVPTRHAIRDGWAIWEGDILLAPAAELIDASTEKVAPRAAAAVVSPWSLWPGGVVPYTIHPQLPNPARATAAIAHWNTQLSGSLRLVPRTSESVYITFQPASPTMCASYIGRIGVPAQPIYAGAYCSTGNLVHEIGHAIGLFHEHTRQDRDRYVKILSENLDPATAYNFQVAFNSASVGAYDFGSIMHYGPYSFSINGRPTIVTVPAGISIGQRSSLSPGDLSAVRSLYPAAAPVYVPPAVPVTTTPAATTAVRITLTSNPTGRLLLVDGRAFTTPAEMSWTPGSAHSVSAPHSSSGDQMFIFSRWSDNGPQTHTFTAPAADSALHATFAVRHRLLLQSNSAGYGQVQTYPASADGFHSAGTIVQATAVPAPGFCFAGWSGIVPISESTIVLALTRPYSLTATFQPGTVSLPPVRQVPHYAHTVSLPVTAQSGCIWNAATDSAWVSVSTAGYHSSLSLPITVSANPTRTPRSGRVRILGQWTTIHQDGRP